MLAKHVSSWISLVLFVGLAFVAWDSRSAYSTFDDLPQWLIYVGGVGALSAIGCIAVTKRKTCPSCRGYTGRKTSRVQVGARPTHARIDGSADRRYKHNPTIRKFEITYRCSGCQNEWHRHVEG